LSQGGHSAEEGYSQGGRCPRYTSELRPLRFEQTEIYFYIMKTNRTTRAEVSNKEQFFAPDQESLIMDSV
jgi:hypothetical protein